MAGLRAEETTCRGRSGQADGLHQEMKRAADVRHEKVGSFSAWATLPG